MYVKGIVGWLVGCWLVGWLVGGLVGWLVGWLVVVINFFCSFKQIFLAAGAVLLSQI